MRDSKLYLAIIRSVVPPPMSMQAMRISLVGVAERLPASVGFRPGLAAGAGNADVSPAASGGRSGQRLGRRLALRRAAAVLVQAC